MKNNTQEIKHSPLPWSVSSPVEFIYDCNSKSVARLTARLTCNSVLNSKFIVKACNSHYELLEACKQAIEILNSEISLKKEFHDDEEYIKPLELAVLTIEKAISKAEGK